MPNWCSNHITVRGTNQREIAEIAEAMREGRFFQSIIPTPEDLNREGSSSHGGPNADEYDKIRAENLEKHGYSNWYDFQVAKWGTKWDVDCHDVEVEDDGLSVSTYFDSAWSPPMGIVEELTDRGLQVTLYYYELSGLDSSTVTAAIGNELDDMFGISESMAEYEAENEEEELTEWIKDGIETRKLETL